MGAVRHHWGWKPTRNLQVPLISTGETHRGFFRVPRSAVTFRPHSNDVHSYDLVVRQKVKEWVEWKGKLGWALRGKPRVLVPVESPTERPGAEPEDGEEMRVYVEGTFYRTKPLYMGLDEFLDRQDDSQRYGIPIDRMGMPENPLPEPKPVIEGTALLDPMTEAEKRRAWLRLKRELEIKDGVAVGARVVKTPADADQTVTGENDG